MRNYKEYTIWQDSKALAINIYKITSTFPDSEKFGLTSQIRRAAVSVPANISEGAGRSTDRDFRSFLFIALGSLNELATLLELAIDLEFINRESIVETLDNTDKLQRSINSLIQRL